MKKLTESFQFYDTVIGIFVCTYPLTVCPDEHVVEEQTQAMYEQALDFKLVCGAEPKMKAFLLFW